MWEGWERKQARKGESERAKTRRTSSLFDTISYPSPFSQVIQQSSCSLPRALATWRDLQTGQECLTRCGVWDELLLFLSEQQAQHLLNPTTTPPLTAPGLAATIKLTRQILMHRRHRSLRAVNQNQFDRFKGRVEELVPRETREDIASAGPKTGNGRRPGRESESSSFSRISRGRFELTFPSLFFHRRASLTSFARRPPASS